MMGASSMSPNPLIQGATCLPPLLGGTPNGGVRMSETSVGSQCGSSSLGQGYAGDMCSYGPMYAAYNYGSMKSRSAPYSRSSPVYPPYHSTPQITPQLYRQPPSYHDYSSR